jgi:hypothetical protein
VVHALLTATEIVPPNLWNRTSIIGVPWPEIIFAFAGTVHT